MLANILKSISPLLLVSRITGYYLFTLSGIQRKAIVTKANVLLILVTAAINLMLTAGFFAISFLPFSPDVVTSLTLPFLYICDLYMNIFAICWLFMQRHKIFAFLEMLAKIDESFAAIGVNHDYEYDRRKLDYFTRVFGGVYFGIVTFNLITYGFFDSGLASLFGLIFDLWCVLLNMTFLFQYIVGVATIGTRFVRFSHSLHHLDTEGTMERIHFMLADCVESYNKIYGPAVIAIFFTFFSWSCFSLFNLMSVLNHAKAEILPTLADSINLFLVLVAFYVLFRAIDRTTRSRRRTISWLLRESLRDKVKEKMYRKFLAQVLHTKVIFSTNLFTLNWHTMFGFVTTAVMYFMIFLQFEASLHGCDPEMPIHKEPIKKRMYIHG